jgi:hypothetical protein
MPGPIFTAQSSFAGGEFSPSLYARVDIAKYLTGMKTIRNFNILPHGGARNRAGTTMVSTAGDSTNAVRLIPFVAATNQAYVIEVGNYYMRFYTADAQVQASGVGAWSGSGTNYVVGNFVTNGGNTYYCIVNNASGSSFAADLASGYWRAQTAYQIVTPYAAADIFNLKFAQSADVLYIAHPSYAPQQLNFNSAANWALAAYSFINGPFMIENTDTTSTITPSALAGSIMLTSSKSIFNAGQVNGLFQLISTIVGQTITPSITSSVKNEIATKSTWQAVTSGTWSGTILIQTSPDNITWTTVSTVVANGTVSGTASFTNGYMRAIMQSSVAFSGSASVVLSGNGNSTGPTVIQVLNAATTPVAAGDTAIITLTSLTGSGDTVLLQKSTDYGATWTTLATYTTNQTSTSVATGETACLIKAIKTVNGGGSPAATVDGTTGAAPTLTVIVSPASVSSAILCGQNWSIITTGGWTGKLRVEISTDGGSNWQLVQTLQSAGSDNFQTSGSTGVSQCLLRVSADPSVSFSGTATIDLTSTTFDWICTVQITAFSNETSVTATVLEQSNSSNTGLANTSATYNWSEGSWSTYRGWPTAVTFYQDRLAWASTNSEPQTIWFSKTASYLDFGISSPVVDTDSISALLPGRQLNAIQTLIVMPQFLIALTSDSEWAINTASGSGSFTPSTYNVQLQGHRGSAAIDPVAVGVELILIQQMGTVVRNMIFQLAVNGFMGDNLSIVSQHLFTGYTIKQMAYQQEPDSIVWAVRSDGELLSCTYMREQEMNAWSHHDTNGLFESVVTIPNQTLGINETWFVVNRTVGGVTTRFIERLMPRDQGTNPANQFFVDCGLTYNSSPATVISGLSYLNGMTVSILADGNVVPAQVVNNGTITLAVAASIVTVGLPYVCDLETLTIEAPDRQGTLQGRRVAIPEVTMRFWNSRGGYFMACSEDVEPADSVSNAGFDELSQRGPGDNYNAPIALKTRDYKVTMNGGYDFGAHVFFRQVDPLPVCLLAFLPSVVAGEK